MLNESQSSSGTSCSLVHMFCLQDDANDAVQAANHEWVVRELYRMNKGSSLTTLHTCCSCLCCQSSGCSHWSAVEIRLIPYLEGCPNVQLWSSWSFATKVQRPELSEKLLQDFLPVLKHLVSTLFLQRQAKRWTKLWPHSTSTASPLWGLCTAGEKECRNMG